MEHFPLSARKPRKLGNRKAMDDAKHFPVRVCVGVRRKGVAREMGGYMYIVGVKSRRTNGEVDDWNSKKKMCPERKALLPLY